MKKTLWQNKRNIDNITDIEYQERKANSLQSNVLNLNNIYYMNNYNKINSNEINNTKNLNNKDNNCIKYEYEYFNKNMFITQSGTI